MSTNFSGTWHVNRHESQLEAEGLRQMEQGTMTIAHAGDHFVLTRCFVIDGTEHAAAFDAQLDGAEHETALPGRTLRLRSEWSEDGALTIHSRILSDGPEATNTVTYRLGAAGQQLLANEVFRSADASYHNRWVLDREV